MRYLLPLILLALAGAGCGPPTVSPDELGMRTVTLPDGQKIRAEVEITPEDMRKGMMFRDALPRGHGMLFVHDKPGFYSYWMYQVKIPLDIIWMDGSHRVVEISADTPPCKTKASECPIYGGHQQAEFVLELGGGAAKRCGLHKGETLEF
jgi:uncharacterized protein